MRRKPMVVCSAVGAVFLMSLGTPVAADPGLIAGVDTGVAVPVSALKNREHVGGMISPFVGYMFTPIFGLMGQAQVAGFPDKDRPGQQDNDMWPLGVHAGPRLAVPVELGSLGTEFYGTFQAGVFTGLTAHTPVSRTSWGFSTGGGVNFRLADTPFLLGAFGRFNQLDQRVQPGKNVQYVTAGLSFTYNEAAPAAIAQVPPPPPKPAPPVQKKLVLRGVNFDFNKFNIRPDARPVLDEAIATLKREGGIAVIAQGYTDSIGSEAYNMQLSLRRANAVRDYLVAGGISPKRITVEGFGETNPVASNATEDGRAQNRRVELRIRGN